MEWSNTIESEYEMHATPMNAPDRYAIIGTIHGTTERLYFELNKGDGMNGS